MVPPRRENRAVFEYAAPAIAVTPPRCGGRLGWTRVSRAEGDQATSRQARTSLAEGWLLPGSSVPDTERHRRYLLRTHLGRLGFANAAPGVWVAPAHLHDETVNALRRAELTPYVELFRA